MKRWIIALVAMLVVVAGSPARADRTFENIYKASAIASQFRPFEDSSSSEVSVSSTVAVLRVGDEQMRRKYTEDLSVLYDPQYRDKKIPKDCEVDENPYEVVYPISPVNNLLPVVPVRSGYFLFVSVDPLGFKKMKEILASTNGGHSNLRVLYVAALDKIGVVIPLDHYRLNGITVNAQGNDFGREHRGLTILFFKVTTKSKDHRNTASLRIPDLAFVPYIGEYDDNPTVYSWAIETMKLIPTQFAGMAPPFDPINDTVAISRYFGVQQKVNQIYYSSGSQALAQAPSVSEKPYKVGIKNRDQYVKTLRVDCTVGFMLKMSGSGYSQRPEGASANWSAITSSLQLEQGEELYNNGGSLTLPVKDDNTVVLLYKGYDGKIVSQQVWPQ